MIRAVGIDPGTLSIDVCGIADGQIYLDRSWPTADALSDATAFLELLTRPGSPEGDITKAALFLGEGGS